MSDADHDNDLDPTMNLHDLLCYSFVRFDYVSTDVVFIGLYSFLAFCFLDYMKPIENYIQIERSFLILLSKLKASKIAAYVGTDEPRFRIVNFLPLSKRAT
jgi:hypothetical protein